MADTYRDALAEIESLRQELAEARDERDRAHQLVGQTTLYGTGYLWRRSDGEELVLDPTEVSVFLPAGQTTPAERLRTAAQHVVDLYRQGNVMATVVAVARLGEVLDGGT